MVKIYEAPYAGWKRCLFIENDTVRLVCTLEVGPRIIRYSLIDGENMFAEYPDHIGRTGDDEWLNYGGHRVWVSPERFPRSYPADNVPITYRVEGNTVTLIPPTEEDNGVQKKLTVTLAEIGSEVTVANTVRNVGRWPVEMAAWALTVTAVGGLEVIPIPPHESSLLPTRRVSLWSYSRMNDPRVYWGERFITVQQDSAVEGPFKLGCDLPDGTVAVFNHGCCFVKQFAVDPHGTYPDFGVPFETYTCEQMTEVESLSPLKMLDEGESITHVERWRLVAAEKPDGRDEASLFAAMEKIR